MIDQRAEPHNGRASEAYLSPEHERMLTGDSAISPEIVAARNYRSARTAKEVPPEFGRGQRRAGLVIPTFCPCGQTAHQLRPDVPRKRGLKYENPTGSRALLDVLPSSWRRLTDPSEPLWVTEGIRKADSLTTAGALAVGLYSVWQFQRGGELLPCWENIALAGRTVYTAFDSDAATNPNVQAALARLSEMLTARGAVVLAVRIPGQADGGKVGIDDHLAAGGNLAALTEHARPVDPEEMRRERLKAAPPLRRGVRALWAAWHGMEPRRTGDYTDRSVFRVLIERGERTGKVDKARGGIVVRLSVRDIADRAAVGRSSACNALARLTAAGYVGRAEAPSEGQAASYVLFTGGGRAKGGQYGEGPRQEHKTPVNASEPPVPIPVQVLRAPSEGVPELRWSAVLAHRELDDKGRAVMVYEGLKRLGKRRQAVLEYVLAVGGEAAISELMGRFASPKARPRDFRRRVLADLESAGIVEVDGDGGAVAVHPEWSERLEQTRLLADEHGAARRQKARFEREREAYRNRRNTPPDRAPTDEEMVPMREWRKGDGFIEDLERVPDPLPIRELYRLIERPVVTVKGPGILWNARSDEVGVVLDDSPAVVTFMHPVDIRGPG